MNGENQDEPERNSRGAVWVWLCWLGVAVLLYFLSSGPLWLILGKNPSMSKPVVHCVAVFYVPVVYVHAYTPLGTPLGMYWHLWDPSHFDRKGKIRSIN
jgi:hypothetical protein